MLEKIKEILESQGFSVDGISEETGLIADLGLNSLNILDVACQLEDAFGVEIPDRSIKDMKTIGDVIRLLESL